MRTALSAACAMLVFAGMGVGLSAAYAEGGDGCRTYAQMIPAPPVYRCIQNECNQPGQSCALSISGPHGAQCDCNGVPQPLDCDPAIIHEEGVGWYLLCVPVNCTNDCDDEAYGFVLAYCKCL